MKFFESASFWAKKYRNTLPNTLLTLGKKELVYLLFLVLLGLFYLLHTDFDISDEKLQNGTLAMEDYDEQLKLNLGSTVPNDIIDIEREQLLMAIEERIVVYLYQVPDYSYVSALETYLQLRPQLLEQFPSAVPLQKGDYSLTSNYGIRSHPISGKTKKHFGIDLAAASGTPVYVLAAALCALIFCSGARKGFESRNGV